MNCTLSNPPVTVGGSKEHGTYTILPISKHLQASLRHLRVIYDGCRSLLSSLYRQAKLNSGRSGRLSESYTGSICPGAPLTWHQGWCSVSADSLFSSPAAPESQQPAWAPEAVSLCVSAWGEDGCCVREVLAIPVL